ncbi:hypothetical protein J8L86_00270 [Shewanella sp. MMG014]|uniref:hypothetical protein n=1 Tax=Shewanella sp. MMG014 TaxID=2822691 RepID=UPI001B362D0E|nr:hypothetical protein [Shewanella sp. MMG014]MBQ4888267.1 hypothetical protein [Shewanella sp. MMG014]
MLKQLGLIVLFVLAGCSSNNQLNEIDANNVAGKYFNDDGFGNSTYLILYEDGRYESKHDGFAGISSYSTGVWSNNGNKISFTPESQSGELKLPLLPMAIMEKNKGLLLVPAKKVNLHQQLMTNFGKSTYTYNR